MTEDQKRAADVIMSAVLVAALVGAVAFMCWKLHGIDRVYRDWTEKLREDIHIGQWEGEL